MVIPRPVRIGLLLTEEEAAKLRKLAEKKGVTCAELLRSWLRDATEKK
jgi:hypothetical protein